jgi:DNA (cytosine-5)-methyltransferase 1
MIKVMSLFTGMGGMDVGFAHQVQVHKNSVDSNFIDREAEIENFVYLKRMPFEVVFQNDILNSAMKIAEWNNWAHNYVCKDIRSLLEENFEFPYADVICGGFPCQDFSHSGKRKGLNSKRGTLYQCFVDVVNRVKPKMFVAENVHGLLTMKGDPIKQIVDDFSNAGYVVEYQLLKCEDYGIPQTRWRVIIMGVRKDVINTLSTGWNTIDYNKRKCTLKHYFKHLKEPNETNDPAQRIYSKAAKLIKGQGQKEICLDNFGPTIRAEHHGNIEFRRHSSGINNENHLPERRLTVREAALIQTFPPHTILTEPNKKPTMTAYKPIGNAVPPLLGYLIANKVYNILKPNFYN